jgi:hypothetical protein
MQNCKSNRTQIDDSRCVGSTLEHRANLPLRWHSQQEATDFKGS